MSLTNRAMPLPKRGVCRSRGFTLIELLVVLVIIIVLIGILVPALSSSRNTARRVASQSQLSGIATAIEAYATMFNQYPGYFSDQTVDTNNSDFTSTENLVLSLMGGVDNTTSQMEEFQVPGTTDKIFFSKIGSGPRVGTGRKVDAFYSAKPEELQVIKQTNSPTGPLGGANMPELIDAISGMPILYYRARSTGTIPAGLAFGDSGKFILDTNRLYLDSTTSGPLITSDGQSYDQATSLLDSTNSDSPENFAWLVTNQKLSRIDNATKAEATETDDVLTGKYVLVAPGPDGIYFSSNQMDDRNGDGNPETNIIKYDEIDNFDDVVHVGGQ